MRKLNLYIKLAIWTTFAIFFIANFVVFANLNSNFETFYSFFQKKLSFNLDDFNFNNFNSLSEFLISSLSFGGFLNFSDSHLANFYIINSYVILPLLGFATLVSLSFFIIFKFGVHLKQFRWKTISKVSRWNMYIFLFLAFGFGLIGSILLSFGNNSEQINAFTNLLYKVDYQNQFIHKENGIEFIVNNFNLLNSMRVGLGLNVALQGNGILSIGYVFLMIITPIFAIMFIISTISRFGFKTLLSSTGNQPYNQLFIWLSYYNISSYREIKKRIYSNTGLIVLAISFIVVMIVPSMITAKDYTGTNAVLLIVSILLLIATFTPTIVIWIMIKTLRNFHYNFYMLLQMFLIAFIGIIWQLICWLFLGAHFNLPPLLTVIEIFAFLACVFVAFKLLLLGYRS